MVKTKTKTKTKAPRRKISEPEAVPYKGAKLAEARRIAREAAKTHPRGVLSLPGVAKPKHPKADVWILQAGDAVRVVVGLSRQGKGWIARYADHSEGYEGEPIFGPGAYRVDPELIPAIMRGLEGAGLTVTP